jgi:DNA-3-methyladenine glycosylase II
LVSLRIVQLPGPLDVPASLEGFRRWGDDGIDRWDGRRLARTARIDGRPVAYRALDAGVPAEPALAIEAPGHGAAEVDQVARAVAGTFLSAPPEFDDLLERDPILAQANARFPGLRPVLQPDLFTALVRSVTAQQLSLRWAAVIRRRLAQTFGRRHELGEGDWVMSLAPEDLAEVRPEDLRSLQLSNRQSSTIIEIARASLDGRLDAARLGSLPDDGVIGELVRLHGIGRWTAEWILARTFGRPVVVAGDLGVRKAIGRAYFSRALATEGEVRRATAHWGGSAGVAQTLLLATLLAPPVSEED